MQFTKYQALGNDYIVVQPQEIAGRLVPQFIRSLCDRHFGAGADGVLVGPLVDSKGGLSVRIFNPDGSEAEKSGNGLRIFGRYLYDQGMVAEDPFRVSTHGGEVWVKVEDGGELIEVNMGKASFHSSQIPVLGPERIVWDEPILIDGQKMRYNALTLGNPHCVLLVNELLQQDVLRYGPLLERHENFPNRTNVQFVKIMARDSIQIEIWERGAGYTLASGSSACAAGIVAYRSGQCDPDIKVHMSGGVLLVSISDGYEVTQKGPAKPVYRGYWLD